MLFFLALVAYTLCADPDQTNSTVVQCKTDFLRSYNLHGYLTSNDTEPFLICPQVESNCCSKHDQRYIFHYLQDLLPRHLEDFKGRRDMAMTKLRRLHNRVLKVENEFKDVGQDKRRFCSTEFRKLKAFPFDEFYAKYSGFSDNWLTFRKKELSTFYCMLCDGGSQGFLTEHPPSVTVSGPFCHNVIKDNKPNIFLWLNNLMTYVKNLQNVIDCNHYIESYNLPFIDEEKLKAAEDGMKCLKTVDDEFSGSCFRLCREIGLASVTPSIDGDPVFIERIVNIFSNFYDNVERGKFLSFETRRFYKKFEIPRELNFTQGEAFKELISQNLKPLIRTVNVTAEVLQRLMPNPRQMEQLKARVGSHKQRKHTEVTIEEPVREFRPSDHSSELMHQSFIDQTNTAFRKEEDNRMIFGNNRFLSAEKSQKAAKSKKKKEIRAAPVARNSHDEVTYDHIKIHEFPPEDNIFRVVSKPFDVDKIPHRVGPDGGAKLDYGLMDLSLSSQAFLEMLFRTRPPDDFDLYIDELSADLGKQTCQEITELFETEFEYPKKLLFIKGLPERRLIMKKDKRIVKELIKSTT